MAEEEDDDIEVYDDIEDSNGNDSNDSKTNSQASLTSLGMGTSLSDLEAAPSARLSPEGGAPPGLTLYDTIAYLIYCSNHKRYALSKTDKGVWLPFVVIPHTKTYSDSSRDGIRIVLSRGHKELDATLMKEPPMKSNITARLTRVQLPNQRFITRLIQIVKLDRKENNDFKCCQNTKRIHWFPKSDVLNGRIDKVWGPEATQMAKLMEHTIIGVIEEFSLNDVFSDINVETSDNNSSAQKMLKSLRIQTKDLEKLYIDFLEHCFPSFYMSFDSFKEYMISYGYSEKDPRLRRMFNAFSIKGNSFIKFDKLLLGLAAMEPNAIHEEFRIGFIFRYYDLNRDKNLSEEEFYIMIRDILGNVNESVVRKKANEGMKEISSKNNNISFDDFTKAITSGVLNGTEQLCRSPKQILHQITTSMTEKSKQRETDKWTVLKTQRKGKGICYGCRNKKFGHGLHSVKFDTTGRCVEPRRIFEPENLREDVINLERVSMEYTFNSRCIANVFLDLIKAFVNDSEKDKAFLAENKELFLKYLVNLCEDTKSVFSNEDRIMKLNSPAVVIGDIRADLKDLFSLERSLWHSFPIISANFLFLGNYIEFGENGLETILYLLSLKLIAPHKIYLLKGRHESRDYQINHKFKTECITKYGEEIGDKVWNLINGVFDQLPIAFIIDESIFCSNGGIPRSTSKVEDIKSMSTDIKCPQKYAVVANEILNNEPLSPNIKVENLDKGFAPMKDRENGFWFNEEAINNFLEKNTFTHIIRSNNIYNSNGYAFHFGTKCLTIFSNSKSKDNNDLATVFIDDDKIRILTIESKNNEKNNTNNN